MDDERDDEVLNGAIELDVSDGQHLVVIIKDASGHTAKAVLGKERAAAFLTICADAAAKLFEIEDG